MDLFRILDRALPAMIGAIIGSLSISVVNRTPPMTAFVLAIVSVACVILLFMFIEVLNAN